MRAINEHMKKMGTTLVELPCLSTISPQYYVMILDIKDCIFFRSPWLPKQSLYHQPSSYSSLEWWGTPCIPIPWCIKSLQGYAHPLPLQPDKVGSQSSPGMLFLVGSSLSESCQLSKIVDAGLPLEFNSCPNSFIRVPDLHSMFLCGYQHLFQPPAVKTFSDSYVSISTITEYCEQYPGLMLHYGMFLNLGQLLFDYSFSL